MIAREGLILISAGVVLTAVLILLAARFDQIWVAVLAALMAVLTVFTIFFFRDPPRSVEASPRALIAPADGKILAIERVEESDFIKGPADKISIFLSVFDVHINRVPASGVVQFVERHDGRFLPAFKPEASRENQRAVIGLTTTDNHRIIVKQITGLIARRIVCHLQPGDTVSAGQRFGMIRFGSRTELWVPAGSKIEVKPGDKVYGGRTILGHLPGNSGASSSADRQERRDVQL
jgi:phosphatidylserine decarboxylase